VKRRIVVAIVAVTALAIALFGIPLAIAIHHLYLTDARTRLEREATLAARDVPVDFATAGDPFDLPGNAKGVTIGLYDLGGRLVSGAGPARADRVVTAALDNEMHDQELGERLVAAVPVAANERVVAVVRAETSAHAAEHRAHLAWALMAALGVAIVGFAGGLAFVQANRLTRPLRRLRDDAGRLGHGDFAIAPHATGVSELDELGDALTSTARRLGLAMEREQSFSTYASHQLRTPLAGLRLAVEAEAASPRADRTAILGESLAVIDRLEATVTDLLRHAREPARAEPLAVAAVLDHVGTHWQPTLAAQGRALRLPGDLDACPTVHASTAAITQALDVLLDNAVRHGAGAVTVTCDVVAGGLAIGVTDEGPGPAAAAAAVTVDEGHGIGLDLATSLVEAERGRLLRPRAEHPATFTIVLTTRALR
jgi:signal transduction histidine kinase